MTSRIPRLSASSTYLRMFALFASVSVDGTAKRKHARCGYLTQRALLTARPTLATPLGCRGRSGADVLHVGHVPPRRRGGLVRGVPALARVHVRRIPVPPAVRGGDRLERAVTHRRFMKQLRQGSDVHRQSSHSRPGSRVLISWSSQALPSGSLNDA